MSHHGYLNAHDALYHDDACGSYDDPYDDDYDDDGGGGALVGDDCSKGQRSEHGTGPTTFCLQWMTC